MFINIGSAIFASTCIRPASLPRIHRSPDAFELFSESCRANHRLNVIALIDQRDPMGSGWQTVKVVRSVKGTVVKTVLSPARMQGIKSIDDGSSWQTLLPSDRVVINQSSPAGSQVQLAGRLQLAKKNYSFALDGTCSVAGRACDRLKIQPHYREMAVWTIWLDQATNYPMRMDSSLDGTVRTDFVSRTVSFPAQVEKSLVTLEIPSGYRVLSYGCPEHLPSPREAERRLGFSPVIPTPLPLGFQIQDLQLSQSDSWKSLVFRLTDGMVRASVYEYLIDSRVKNVKPFDNSSTTSVGDIQVMLVSDMSRQCRERLLSCFTVKKPSAFLFKP